MDIQFQEFHVNEGATLAAFLTQQPWPFHAGPPLTKNRIVQQVRNGYYTHHGSKTFWMINDDYGIVGYMRLFDLGDLDNAEDPETPLFDIRIAEAFQRHGIGTQAVQWLTNYIFRHYTKKNRIEATTRFDNIAMRTVLHKCGYAKEAHYRQSWPVDGQTPVDGVGYSILRNDWLNQTTTPVHWHDRP